MSKWPEIVYIKTTDLQELALDNLKLLRLLAEAAPHIVDLTAERPNEYLIVDTLRGNVREATRSQLRISGTPDQFGHLQVKLERVPYVHKRR